MLKYLAKRTLLLIPTLVGITLVSFTLVNLAPGGPVEQKINALRFGPRASGGPRAGVVDPSVVAAMRAQYGFDKPVLTRYLGWLKNLVRLDFGNSSVYGAPALEIIAERAPVSLAYGVASFIITYAVSITLGLVMAMRAGRPFDVTMSYALILLAALPAFIVGVLMLVFLAGDKFLGWFPMGYVQSDNYGELGPLARVFDRLHHAVLPLTCYVLGSFTALTFLGRNNVIEESRKDYARTARAKGLGDFAIWSRHVLRNALIPLVTGLGGALAVFFGGSVLVESVFQLNGLGLLGFQSVMARDYNLIMALLFISSLILLVGNLVSDVLYAMVDPRVRLE